jgi:ADP-ribosylglycohydrolase
MERLRSRIVGCLLGTAVGDALGLPMEGLSRDRQRKFYPELKGYRLVLGRGMVSDDTEHAIMTARALARSVGNGRVFSDMLARSLRLWLLCLPAGVGFATLRSLLKLWMGVSPERSGVFSAGCGPAMRSPIIGVCYGAETDRLKDLVRISTRITHTDPKAEWGALAVSLAAHLAGGREGDPGVYLDSLKNVLPAGADELLSLIRRAHESALRGSSTISFAEELGLRKGASGYMYHVVPLALHAWFSHPADIRAALTGLIRCGGDTDTLAAVAGGIIGAGAGPEGIPEDLVSGLWEWPMTVERIEELGLQLADALYEGTGRKVRRPSLFMTMARNVFFLLVVLSHGLRRLLPPY